MKLLRNSFILLIACVTGAQAVEFTKPQSMAITKVVGQIMEHFHYKQTAMDDEVSEMFLDNYLNSLDPQRMIFFQSDVDEFKARFRHRLDDFTNLGRTGPAFEIYDVYKKRLSERIDMVFQLLKEDFNFEAEDYFMKDREEEPWPSNTEEARRLWHGRVKAELLRDRLDKIKDENLADNTVVQGDESKPYDNSELIQRLEKRYTLLLKSKVEDTDSSDVLNYYLTALTMAYDPHSTYMSPINAENFDIRSVSLSLTGIGAELRVNEDGITTIYRLIKGGPAAKSKKLQPGDKIIAVAQADEESVDVREKPINKVVQLIRGPVGTRVCLTIIPVKSVDGMMEKDVCLVRDVIQLEEQHARAYIVDHLSDKGESLRLGVVDLDGFYEDCTKDVRQLLNRMQKEGVKGIVLDLRHNGGGLLPEAVDLAGLFFEKGPVVQVRGIRNQHDKLEDTNPDVAYDGSLVVLANHLSASASEIVAGALQDYKRAVIVGGQSTHGKGTVQTLYEVNRFLQEGLVEDAGKIKFTVSKFFRVAGETTQKQGVTPDIVLPSIYDHMEIGEASLPNALPATKTIALSYDRSDKVSDSQLAVLRDRSKQRVAEDQEFAYIQEDIKRLIEQQEEKLVSLKESERRQERREMKERNEQRKEERKQRPESKHLVYELNLEMVKEDQPMMLLAEAIKQREAEQPVYREEEEKSSEPEDEEEDFENQLDPELSETLNILRDFIELQGLGLAKSHDAPVTSPN